MLSETIKAQEAARPVKHAEASPIDPQALSDLAALADEDNPSFLVNLFGDFIRDTLAHLVAMQAAGRSGDTTALVRHAHTLKSSSGNLGAGAMAELCRTIEHQAAQGALAGVEQMLNRLDQEFRRVRQTLELETARHLPPDLL